MRSFALKPWRTGLWAVLALATLAGGWQRQQEVMEWPHLSAPMGPTDPDGWVRLTQVRQWISGGDFYNHNIAATNAPLGGTDIHWTRPVDFLLALFTKLAPGSSIDQQLMVGAAYFAPLTGLAALALLVWGGRRLFNSTQVLGCMALLAVFSTTLYNHFNAGNADHHGLLAALWCAVIGLSVKPLTKRGGVILGLCLGLMTWISPEALVLAAAVYAVLGAFALRNPKEMESLALAMLSAALTVLVGLVIDVPPDKVFAHVTYDELSIAHVALFSFVAAAGALLALVFPRLPVKKRVAAGGLAGVAVLALEYVFFPKFFHGPFVDADPFIFSGYLPLVKEAQPLFESPLCVPIIAQPVLAALLLWGKWRKDARDGRRRAGIVFAVLLGVTFVMVACQIRYMYYVQPMAIAIIGAWLPGIAGQARGALRWLKPLPRAGRAYIVILLVALVSALGTKFTAKPPGRVDYCYAEMRYVLQTNQLSSIMKDNTVILGPEKASGDVLFFTPYRLITIRFHREGKAMHDLQDIIDAASADAARKLLKQRQVGAVFACTADYPAQSWLHSLSAAHHPSWAKPLSGLHFMSPVTPKPLLFSVAPG